MGPIGAEGVIPAGLDELKGVELVFDGREAAHVIGVGGRDAEGGLIGVAVIDAEFGVFPGRGLLIGQIIDVHEVGACESRAIGKAEIDMPHPNAGLAWQSVPIVLVDGFGVLPVKPIGCVKLNQNIFVESGAVPGIGEEDAIAVFLTRVDGDGRVAGHDIGLNPAIKQFGGDVVVADVIVHHDRAASRKVPAVFGLVGVIVVVGPEDMAEFVDDGVAVDLPFPHVLEEIQ